MTWWWYGWCVGGGCDDGVVVGWCVGGDVDCCGDGVLTWCGGGMAGVMVVVGGCGGGMAGIVVVVSR